MSLFVFGAKAKEEKVPVRGQRAKKALQVGQQVIWGAVRVWPDNQQVTQEWPVASDFNLEMVRSHWLS